MLKSAPGTSNRAGLFLNDNLFPAIEIRMLYQVFFIKINTIGAFANAPLKQALKKWQHPALFFYQGNIFRVLFPSNPFPKSKCNAVSR